MDGHSPLQFPPAWYTAVVVTVSDSVSAGNRVDEGGNLAQSLLEDTGFHTIHRAIVADERRAIADIIADWCDTQEVGLVVTTGGTGMGPRDVTPEATLDVCEYQVPGMAEGMRYESLAKTPFAMISRQVVGVRNQTLVINLPGSAKAVQQCLETVSPVLIHAVNLLHGETKHGD